MMLVLIGWYPATFVASMLTMFAVVLAVLDVHDRALQARVAALRSLAGRSPGVSWIAPEPTPYGRDRIGSDPDDNPKPE